MEIFFFLEDKINKRLARSLEDVRAKKKMRQKDLFLK